MPEASPFLKWAGGKARLLEQLKRLLPKDASQRTFHEPFLGGGALFFSLLPAKAYLSDINPDLIATYEAVRHEPEQVLVELAALAPLLTADDYLAQRERWNAQAGTLRSAARAALFIYLNKRGFNGLWRVNRRGQFNVPPGRTSTGKPRLALVRPRGLTAASAALATAELRTSPFECVLANAQKEDLVYFDPPYVPLSKSANFTSYAKDGFGPFDQARLATVFRELDRRGCKVMLSNSDTPLVAELYQGYRIERVQAARSINSDPKGRGKLSEVVICNYDDTLSSQPRPSINAGSSEDSRLRRRVPFCQEDMRERVEA